MESKVTINDDLFRKSLAEQTRRLKNLKPVMQIVAQDMQTQKDLNFRKETDPDGKPWKDLKDSTKKARRGTSYRILSDKAILKANSSYKLKTDNKSASIGTNLKYAPVHQFGHTFTGIYQSGNKMGQRYTWSIPQRQFLGINKKMNNKYKKLVINYVLNGKR